MSGQSSMRSPTVTLGHCCFAMRAVRQTPGGWTNAPIFPRSSVLDGTSRGPSAISATTARKWSPTELVAEVERQAARGDGWVKLVGDWIDGDIGDLMPLWPTDVAEAAITRAHELGLPGDRPRLR